VSQAAQEDSQEALAGGPAAQALVTAGVEVEVAVVAAKAVAVLGGGETVVEVAVTQPLELEEGHVGQRRVAARVVSVRRKENAARH
jgi:hypothetical protein